MTPRLSAGQVLERLKGILAEAPLSAGARETGRGLEKRLSSPVRVTLLGPPGQGKTALLNALTGTLIIPDDVVMPTYEIWHSDTPFVVATRRDGTTALMEELDFARLARLKPVFVQIYAPVDMLKRVRLMEVVTDGSRDEMAAAIRWAAKRTDIAIWCSRGFGAAEQAQWARVPDAVKDHAFLALTHADRQAPDALARRLGAVCEAMAGEFNAILPVATAQALAAQRAGGGDRERLVKASGLTALRSELFRHIDLGRQADIDHAYMFISRFEKLAPEAAASAGPEPLGLDNLRRIADQPAQRPAAEPRRIFADGAAYLRSQAAELMCDIEEFGTDAAKPMLDRCVDAANTLVDMVAGGGSATEWEAQAADAAMDAADALLLLSLENSPDAAENALNLLLQVKIDFEVAAAA